MVGCACFYKKRKLIAIVVLIVVCCYALYWSESSPNIFRPSTQRFSKTSMSHEETCTIKKNIVFAKTHKTAGSTVQNILLRYGLRHNLKFALPTNKHDYSYPSWFNSKQIYQQSITNSQRSAAPAFGPYNIICHHMRFNYEKIKSIMPNNSVYITIVREPGKLFQSTFDYLWGLVLVFHAVAHHEDNAAEKWLDGATHYFRPRKISSHSFFAKNHMMFDLGYSYENEIDSYVALAIAELDKVFDLVLIADYFDESIVLLSHLLCCQLEEVVYLSLNARTTRSILLTNQQVRLSKKARLWNKADAALFDHFNATLWRKVKNYGFDKMASDIKRLQLLKTDIIKLCIEGGVPVAYSNLTAEDWRGSMYRPIDVDLTGYNLKKGAEKLGECKHLIMTPRALTNYVFKLQENLL